MSEDEERFIPHSRPLGLLGFLAGARPNARIRVRGHEERPWPLPTGKVSLGVAAGALFASQSEKEQRWRKGRAYVITHNGDDADQADGGPPPNTSHDKMPEGGKPGGGSEYEKIKKKQKSPAAPATAGQGQQENEQPAASQVVRMSGALPNISGAAPPAVTPPPASTPHASQAVVLTSQPPQAANAEAAAAATDTTPAPAQEAPDNAAMPTAPVLPTSTAVPEAPRVPAPPREEQTMPLSAVATLFAKVEQLTAELAQTQSELRRVKAEQLQMTQRQNG